MKQVNLRLPEELYDRVEQARGSVPRERWLRDVVELVLDDGRLLSRHSPGPDVTRLRSSEQSKRDVKPIPKKK